MKILTIGLTFLLSSSIIYGSTLISASVYSQVLAGTDGLGWDNRYGVYGTAFREIGTFPVILSILLGLIGVMLVVKSIRKK
ncbi:phosphatase [Mesobacillus foraminis]|uniref:phosphatase n=1 Tax=Mesobacillus foraminis TaxID=279826 RepID=UPI001BE53444|nr:phosphatase [Mesobacillus foraminis]MBT2757527.1 phosphatase [Mesobacillus foraminis]